MNAFTTIATGLGAALLATTMLAGTANAGPKPQIKISKQMIVPKSIIVKPVRPTITRPMAKVRIHRGELEPKAEHDDKQPANGAASSAQPRKVGKIAALVPPARLPRPRPDFADAADDIKDAIGADGLAEINPDDMRVTTNPHSAGGRLGDFGLPGAGEEEQQATASGPSGPFGGMGGNDSMWNDPRGAIDSSIMDPAGANNHSKDAPSAFGGLSVKSVRVSDINPAGEKDPKVSDTGWRTFSDSRGSFWTRSITTTYPDRSSVSEVYTESDGDLIQEVTITDPDGNYDTTVTVYDENGDQVGEPDYSTGTIVTELRNPDYTDGGGYVPVNCGSVECNESRKGRPGLRLSDGMVRALTDPEHSAAGPRKGVAPIVTQHDLLSQYDLDFTGGGAPTPIDKPRIQSD